MAKPDAYKPTHRLTTQQPPAIVGQLDNILETKELSLENNEDDGEEEHGDNHGGHSAVKEAMNKELAQLLNKNE
eukprot:3578373-Amphidinium_carterae.2